MADEAGGLMLSSVMVDVSEPRSDEGRCGAIGRGRAIVAIMMGGVLVPCVGVALGAWRQRSAVGLSFTSGIERPSLT
jgi:hypothetical protein